MVFQIVFIISLSLSIITVIIGFLLKQHYFINGMKINVKTQLGFEMLTKAGKVESNQRFKKELHNLKIILIVQIALIIMTFFSYLFTSILTDPRDAPLIITDKTDALP